ncbi:ring-exported protein 3 [Plasmodium reichenowi]|uniref:Ring-exported protein 3 n=1 Tax=Plasmodium reichenowi TaxID=5854 RepID=A0A060RST0_PLARE|nr:ring-exported protein 3 [Plasmodium reichenowi]
MQTRKYNKMLSKVEMKQFIYLLFFLCLYLNTFNYKYTNSYEGNSFRKLSEPVVEEEDLKKTNAESSHIEPTTSQVSHEQELKTPSLNVEETQSNKVSNKIYNFPIPSAEGTVSKEFKKQPKTEYEKKLFEEWQHLNMFEHSNWVNITVQSCQVLVQGLTSLDDYDAKFKSWSAMVELLGEFRMTLFNESNNIFEALLNELREARKENPNENLTPEEEEKWDIIKQTKLEKDIEWKIYQILTWKYWNLKEFPGVDIPDPSVPSLDFDATYDVLGDLLEDDEDDEDMAEPSTSSSLKK